MKLWLSSFLLLSCGRLVCQSQHQTVWASGTIEADGLKGSWSRCVSAAGGWSESARFDAYSVGSGADELGRWVQDRSGGVHTLNSPSAQSSAVTEKWLALQVWSPLVSPSAKRSRGVQHVAPAGGQTLDVTWDPMGHPVETRRQVSTEIEKVEYSDFLDVNGQERPFVITSTQGGSTSRIVVQRYQNGPNLRPCARPPQPSDATLHKPSVTIPLEFDGDLIVQATINGKGPYAFVLDTGGHDILTPAAAAELGLQPTGKSVSSGPGGALIPTQDVRVQELRVGEATLHDQHFFVMPLAYAITDRGGQPPAAGILGLEFLERFHVVIEYGRHTLTLKPSGSALQGTSLPMTFSDDIPLIDATMDGHEGKFSIDTGNSGSVLLQSSWIQQVGMDAKIKAGFAVTTLGVGGTSHAYALPDQSITFAGRELSGITTTMIEDKKGPFSSTTEAGNFGNAVLSAFTIELDIAADRLALTPRTDWKAMPFSRSGFGAVKATPELLVIANVIAGSPAANAGLTAGQQLLSLDGVPAAKLSRRDVVRASVRPAGSSLTVTVQSPNGPRAVHLTLQDFHAAERLSSAPPLH